MNKSQIFLISAVLLIIFLIVYTPHYSNPYPSHVDEWHHITEALKLKAGEYSGGTMSYRVGFHFMLMVLSSFVNLVLIYQYLPAFWACISALILFYVTYKKTNEFYISLFAMIFFVFIKSNVNITGTWFFTPLSFSIPFIYLYIYFFDKGIEKNHNPSLLISLLIMIFLIFIHPIAVTFAIPMLLIYLLINFKAVLKRKIFLFFLLIPIIGLLFFLGVTNHPIQQFSSIFKALTFPYGWGVLELDPYLLDLYTAVGYLFAMIGIIYLILKEYKKYLLYLLWPATVIISICIFLIFKVSFLAPYQRNLYYLLISLPFLSSIGLFVTIKKILDQKWKINKWIAAILVCLTIALSIPFINPIPELAPYSLIDQNDYNSLTYLSTLPKGRVMADTSISTAMYAISGHEPVAAIYFYGDTHVPELFFGDSNCSQMKKLITDNKVDYVLSKTAINCGWERLYQESNFIYRVKP